MLTKKIVVVQICLALVAFFVTAWVFFKERPQSVVNHDLQQEITQVKQTNQTLQQQVKTTENDRKQSRQCLRAGRDLLHQKRFNEAVAEYDKALQLLPDDPYGWSLKGYALFRAGRIPESIEANKKAVQLDPGDPLNFIDLAKSYCAANQFEDAKKALLSDPPSDVQSDVRGYVQTDYELRRVCRPILAQIPKPQGQ